MAMKNPADFTTEQAATYLRLSIHTVRKHVKDRKLKPKKVGSMLFFDQAECDRFLKEKRGPGRPPEKS